MVQLGARLEGGEVVVGAVDALALDLRPLLELLADPSRLKLLHAGRLDLQVLLQLHGALPGPVFDTQRAAALVGFGGQIGYAALVEQVTGRRLEKSEQWSDWTRRPLREAQLRYALDDVRHLPDAAATLRGLLRQAGRHGWAEEEMRELMDPATYADPVPGEEWRRVKAARSLAPRAQAILRELCAWREKAARQRDLRPGFLVKDPILLDLARHPARTPDDLRRAGVHPAEVKRSANELLAALRRGADAEPPEQRRPKRRLDVGAAVDLLRAWLTRCASESSVAPEVMATTADLEALAKAHARGEPWPDLPVLSGWRRELVGADLLRLLEGKIALKLDGKAGLRAVTPPDAAENPE